MPEQPRSRAGGPAGTEIESDAEALVDDSLAHVIGVDAAVPLAAVEAGSGARKRLGIGAWLGLGWLVLMVAIAILAPVLPIDDPNESVRVDGEIITEASPSAEAWFGTDGNGRDVFARTIVGTRASLSVAVGAVMLGLVLGGFLGLISGYYQNRISIVILGLLDVFLAFPALVLALALSTFLRGDPNQEGGLQLPTELVVILAIGIVSIPILGRITRASTLTWSQREFVLAARAQGARNVRIMVRDVLPNVLPAMFSIALLGIAVAIVAEGGLSILGVGIQLPTPSWGNMIAEGRADLRDSPWIIFFPSLFIFFTVLALNYLGDVIRARFDVRESVL